MQNDAASRKAKRKHERLAKKRRSTVSVRKKNTNTEDDSNDNHNIAEKKLVIKMTRKEPNQKKSVSSKNDKYKDINPDLLAAMKNDDEEIAMLESKLGISSSKDKKKLKKEYAKLEGYGDDFGDFLDGLDGMMDNVLTGANEEEGSYSEDEREEPSLNDELELSEEEVEMKEPSSDLDEDFDEDITSQRKNDSFNRVGDDEEIEDADTDDDDNHLNETDEADDSEDEDDSGDDDNEQDLKMSKDHDVKHTYKPLPGQDLYGNVVDNNSGNDNKPAKYIPPHLRKQNEQEKSQQNTNPQSEYDDQDRRESLSSIRRNLNNSLNRLSDNTLESVSKSIASLFSSFPSRDVNELFWENIKSTCIVPHMVMTSLTPMYIACVAGVHFQAGDIIQFGGHVLEMTVLELWKLLEQERNNLKPKGNMDAANSEDSVKEDNKLSSDSKKVSNMMLILCYLYNYSVVHCTIIYDIVRDLIKNFTEIDVEVLLLILQHCGYQLRSDDPAALKDIVFLVNKRSIDILEDVPKLGAETVSSSRLQHMISAITDLKNNKRRSKDTLFGEKTASYRKAIGRMKSSLVSSKTSNLASSKISLQDILDISKKGRWWKVGASWIGNQHKIKGEDETQADVVEAVSSTSKDIVTDDEEKQLLLLASKNRMNTETRRSIFCMVMSSDDCEHAYEKLLRSNMLKGKTERDTVRVIIDCCGQENVYNPYYYHLISRICDFQPKCKFTIQLAFWDLFKQFEDMRQRKAANIAKFLATLVINGTINLSVLKVINIEPSNMPETAIIFLTILFTKVFESSSDTELVKGLFKRVISVNRQMSNTDEDLLVENENESLLENLSVFLLQYLKFSPKNVKGSTFRRNFKVAVKACENDGFDMI